MAVNLSPPPILQVFNNAGQPNAGGTVLTQVGGVNTATFQDSAGAVALPNPIPLNARGEISNAAGVSSQLYLTAGTVYTFTVFDAAGNQLYIAPAVAGAATGADIANLQSQITAFSTSITTGALTVSGASTLHAVTCTTLTASGLATLTGGATLGANLAMGGNSITGAANITASGTVTAGSFSSTAVNAASFFASAATTTGNVVNFNSNGTSTGSGITNSAGTITLANAGTYEVTFAGMLQQPSGLININTGMFFGGTANVIVGPVTANPQNVSIAGANGDVYGYITMRALVVTNAANQTLTVNSSVAFSTNFQTFPNCYLVIAQR